MQEATTVDTQTLVVTSAYDVAGRLLLRTYPDSTTSGTHAYNAAGQLTSIAGAIGDITYTAGTPSVGPATS